MSKGKKQEKQIKQAVNGMNMNQMLKAAELNDFRLLTTIGYLNRLAMISDNDHPFTPLSTIKDMTDEQKASVLASHIVYHDDACYEEEDGTKSYPVISAIGGMSEDGKLEVTYADTMYGQTETHFRLVDDGDSMFVTVFCEGADRTIIVTDGEWFAM